MEKKKFGSVEGSVSEDWRRRMHTRLEELFVGVADLLFCFVVYVERYLA